MTYELRRVIASTDGKTGKKKDEQRVSTQNRRKRRKRLGKGEKRKEEKNKRKKEKKKKEKRKRKKKKEEKEGGVREPHKKESFFGSQTNGDDNRYQNTSEKKKTQKQFSVVFSIHFSK